VAEAGNESQQLPISMMMEAVDGAQKAGDFGSAKNMLKIVREQMRPKQPDAPEAPKPAEDPYIIQRLALVTYKEKHAQPEKTLAALEEARELLRELNPETSNDTETLGIWGGIHKRLWDQTGDVRMLDEAVRSYERGFYLRNDYYNGINLAYLLNIRSANSSSRASSSEDPGEVRSERAKAVADYVQAQRIRKEVFAICEQWLKDNPAPDEAKASGQALADYQNSRYWVLATRAEAILGMGDKAQADEAYKDAYAKAPEKWMVDNSTEPQRQRLAAMLDNSPMDYIKAG
jgi:MAP3K TRAFs-binding domain